MGYRHASRIAVSGFGCREFRYDCAVFDLEGCDGPESTLFMGGNGVGKTSLLGFLLNHFCPDESSFIPAKQLKRSGKQRIGLSDYLDPEGEVAFCAFEWKEKAGDVQMGLFGDEYEATLVTVSAVWLDGESMNRQFMMFKPDENMDFDRLPFVAGKRLMRGKLKDFVKEVKSRGKEAMFFNRIGEWRDRLDKMGFRRGVFEAAAKYNFQEGGDSTFLIEGDRCQKEIHFLSFLLESGLDAEDVENARKSLEKMSQDSDKLKFFNLASSTIESASGLIGEAMPVSRETDEACAARARAGARNAGVKAAAEKGAKEARAMQDALNAETLSLNDAMIRIGGQISMKKTDAASFRAERLGRKREMLSKAASLLGNRRKRLEGGLFMIRDLIPIFMDLKEIRKRMKSFGDQKGMFEKARREASASAGKYAKALCEDMEGFAREKAALSLEIERLGKERALLEKEISDCDKRQGRLESEARGLESEERAILERTAGKDRPGMGSEECGAALADARVEAGRMIAESKSGHERLLSENAENIGRIERQRKTLLDELDALGKKKAAIEAEIGFLDGDIARMLDEKERLSGQIAVLGESLSDLGDRISLADGKLLEFGDCRRRDIVEAERNRLEDDRNRLNVGMAGILRDGEELDAFLRFLDGNGISMEALDEDSILEKENELEDLRGRMDGINGEIARLANLRGDGGNVADAVNALMEMGFSSARPSVGMLEGLDASKAAEYTCLFHGVAVSPEDFGEMDFSRPVGGISFPIQVFSGYPEKSAQATLLPDTDDAWNAGRTESRLASLRIERGNLRNRISAIESLAGTLRIAIERCKGLRFFSRDDFEKARKKVEREISLNLSKSESLAWELSRIEEKGAMERERSLLAEKRDSLALSMKKLDEQDALLSSLLEKSREKAELRKGELGAIEKKLLESGTGGLDAMLDSLSSRRETLHKILQALEGKDADRIGEWLPDLAESLSSLHRRMDEIGEWLALAIEYERLDGVRSELSRVDGELSGLVSEIAEKRRALDEAKDAAASANDRINSLSAAIGETKGVLSSLEGECVQFRLDFRKEGDVPRERAKAIWERAKADFIESQKTMGDYDNLDKSGRELAKRIKDRMAGYPGPGFHACEARALLRRMGLRMAPLSGMREAEEKLSRELAKNGRFIDRNSQLLADVKAEMNLLPKGLPTRQDIPFADLERLAAACDTEIAAGEEELAKINRRKLEIDGQRPEISSIVDAFETAARVIGPCGFEPLAEPVEAGWKEIVDAARTAVAKLHEAEKRCDILLDERGKLLARVREIFLDCTRKADGMEDIEGFGMIDQMKTNLSNMRLALEPGSARITDSLLGISRILGNWATDIEGAMEEQKEMMDASVTSFTFLAEHAFDLIRRVHDVKTPENARMGRYAKKPLVQFARIHSMKKPDMGPAARKVLSETPLKELKIDGRLACSIVLGIMKTGMGFSPSDDLGMRMLVFNNRDIYVDMETACSNAQNKFALFMGYLATSKAALDQMGKVSAGAKKGAAVLFGDNIFGAADPMYKRHVSEIIAGIGFQCIFFAPSKDTLFRNIYDLKKTDTGLVMSCRQGENQCAQP